MSPEAPSFLNKTNPEQGRSVHNGTAATFRNRDNLEERPGDPYKDYHANAKANAKQNKTLRITLIGNVSGEALYEMSSKEPDTISTEITWEST